LIDRVGEQVKRRSKLVYEYCAKEIFWEFIPRGHVHPTGVFIEDGLELRAWRWSQEFLLFQ
jgi:hypothetical protein